MNGVVISGKWGAPGGPKKRGAQAAAVPLPRSAPAQEWRAQPVSLGVKLRPLQDVAVAGRGDPSVPRSPANSVPRQRGAGEQVEWQARPWKPEERQERPRTRGAVGVSTFARRVITGELARARRSKPGGVFARLRGKTRGLRQPEQKE